MSVGQLDLLSEDYEAVDHRLKLFLDVEVFEEEEELHSFLKVSRTNVLTTVNSSVTWLNPVTAVLLRSSVNC